MNQVIRQEKKFLISLKEFFQYSNHLEQVLMQDPHNKTNGYMVRSLYFDTLDDKDFFEKKDGLEVRRKIRLRIYDPKDDFALLEMKQKQGSCQLKRSIRLLKEDSIALTNGNYSPLLKYKEPFAAECYGIMNYLCYRPKAILQYNRKAFFTKENHIRITFDNNIIATESNFDLFSSNLCMYPVLDQYNVVLEVKYNNFLLSYIREMINKCDKSELSVSKYCLSRSIGLKYVF